MTFFCCYTKLAKKGYKGKSIINSTLWQPLAVLVITEKMCSTFTVG